MGFSQVWLNLTFWQYFNPLDPAGLNMAKLFFSAFFFAGTVATTIGYGQLVPMTSYGKLFCIV